MVIKNNYWHCLVDNSTIVIFLNNLLRLLIEIKRPNQSAKDKEDVFNLDNKE